MGRTGRAHAGDSLASRSVAGAQGTAVSLLTEIEARLVRRYEHELGITMQCVKVRTAVSRLHFLHDARHHREARRYRALQQANAEIGRLTLKPTAAATVAILH